MHIAFIMGRIEEIGEKHHFHGSGDPKKSQNNEKILQIFFRKLSTCSKNLPCSFKTSVVHYYPNNT